MKCKNCGHGIVRYHGSLGWFHRGNPNGNRCQECPGTSYPFEGSCIRPEPVFSKVFPQKKLKASRGEKRLNTTLATRDKLPLDKVAPVCDKSEVIKKPKSALYSAESPRNPESFQKDKTKETLKELENMGFHVGVALGVKKEGAKK